VIYLLDSDHSSILQRQSGPEFATLMGQVAQQARTELAFSIISTHEQLLGCHA
jgi:tRNA(fMet)-specific endonuclease VapC